MTFVFGIIFAALLVLFSILTIVNSESKRTIFNDTSTAFIAKMIFLVLLISMFFAFRAT